MKNRRESYLKAWKLLGIAVFIAAIGFSFAACDVDAILDRLDKHTHSYAGAWSYDETQHWRECTEGDGAKTDVGNHNPSIWMVDEAATETTPGSRHKECTFCGYLLAEEAIPATGVGHVHSFNATWSYNATQHWKECSTCGEKKDTANHNNPCAICGYSDLPPITINGITAAQLVSNIKIGWNLGNTLDAHHLEWLGANPSVSALETGWGAPVTTKANITALKNAGFNAIRIPVSWFKAMDSNYNIRADWMARVKEVVNYAVENDMYILLNTHHDEDIFKFTPSEKAESLRAFRKTWEQIAAAFKDYNEKLVFEGLNEPRTIYGPNEWGGGTADERAVLNEHYQVFVDTVRASGGNNSKRVLMVNTYAASAVAAAVNGLVLPNDPEKDKLIVSIHAYVPNNFALERTSPVKTWSQNNSSDTTPIRDAVDRAYNKFVSNGIPVIFGEFGALNKNNTAARAEWSEYYVRYARSKNIPCFWWDNANANVASETSGEGFQLLDRRTNTFTFPEVVAGLMRGLNGDAPPPIPPTTPGGINTKTVTLERNTGEGYDNWQGLYEELPLNGGRITSGSTYTFTYSFKSSAAIPGTLKVFLVDNTEAGGWWTMLSNDTPLRTGIQANTEITGSIVISATATASSTNSAANKLVFNITPASGAVSEPTLTFTTFTFVRNQKVKLIWGNRLVPPLSLL